MTVIAGIGCRKGAGADAVLAALDAALSRAGLSRVSLGALATSPAKASEPGIVAAAAALAVPVLAPYDAELREADRRTPTRSAASAAASGLGSVSEAAALAAAGPHGRLLAPRLALGPATCALAETDEVFLTSRKGAYGLSASPVVP